MCVRAPCWVGEHPPCVCTCPGEGRGPVLYLLGLQPPTLCKITEHSSLHPQLFQAIPGFNRVTGASSWLLGLVPQGHKGIPILI